MAKPSITKQKQKKIALERIRTLFSEAANNKELADRYVFLARKIAMKAKIAIPPKYKRRFCKHCYNYLTPGVNARVRTRQGKVIISCLGCKRFMRIPFHTRN